MANINPHGVVGYFKTPSEILAATKAMKAKGLKEIDTFSPFPIHGIEEVLGYKPSIVPWATLLCGITGFCVALHLQVWTSAYDWPINVGGKPFISLPAFIPILFELTVLLGGLGTAFFMFFLNGLPNFNPSPLSPRVTDDRFALYIPFTGQGVSAAEVENHLKATKPESVTVLSEPL